MLLHKHHIIDPPFGCVGIVIRYVPVAVFDSETPVCLYPKFTVADIAFATQWKAVQGFDA